jgi:hypothetical protein
MHALAILLTTAALGVDFGWQGQDDGQTEYIIQIEPELIESLAEGQEITSEIHPEAGDVRRFSIRIGTGPVPRETRRPVSEQSAPEGSPSAATTLEGGAGGAIDDERQAGGVPRLPAARTAVPLVAESVRDMSSVLVQPQRWSDEDEGPHPGPLPAREGVAQPQRWATELDAAADVSPAEPAAPADPDQLAAGDAVDASPQRELNSGQDDRWGTYVAPAAAHEPAGDRFRAAEADPDYRETRPDAVLLEPPAPLSHDAEQSPAATASGPFALPLASPAAAPAAPLRESEAAGEPPAQSEAGLGDSRWASYTSSPAASAPAESAASPAAPAPAPAAASQPASSAPGWGWALGLLFGLFLSIGGNIYLGWTVWDTHTRYQDLVADLHDAEEKAARSERYERHRSQPAAKD